MQQKT